MNDQVVYVSNVRIERVKGPFRRAYLPVESEPVKFIWSPLQRVD
jgi:hypothetical protein